MLATTIHNRVSKEARVEAKGRKELEYLTLLRAFAALWVVLYHARISLLAPYLKTQSPWINHFVSMGYVGVPFFFFLSGFILTHVYGEACGSMGAFPLRKFYTARFARISPLYAVGMVVAIPYFIATWKGLSVVNRFASVFLVPTFMQSWFPAVALAWNPPAWSLSVEAFFYFSFPYLLKKLLPLTKTVLMALYCFSILIAVIICYVLMLHDLTLANPAYLAPGGPYASLARYHPLVNLPIFFAGVAIGTTYRKQVLAPSVLPYVAYGSILLGVVAIFFAVSYSEYIPFILAHNALFIPVATVIVLGAAWLSEVHHFRPLPRFLTILGESSFALYLLHGCLLIYVAKVFVVTGFNMTPVMSVFMSILFMVSACLLSFLSWRFIEVPLRRLIIRKAS